MRNLRQVLIRELVLLLAAAVAAVCLLAWFGMTRLANRQVDSRVASDLLQIDHTLTHEFQNLEHLGDTLAVWWQQGQLDPLREGDAWSKLAPLMAPFKMATSLNFLRVDGQGLGLGRVKDGLAARSIRLKDGVLASGAILGAHQSLYRMDDANATRTVDYRTRPWFRLGSNLREGTWSDPFIYIGRNNGLPGISYVIPVRDAAGQLLGVISIDVLLESMTQALQEIRPTPLSTVMALDAAGRVIVPPPKEGHTSPASLRGSFLRQVDEPTYPMASALFTARAQAPAGRDEQPFRLKQGGQVGFLKNFQGAKGIHWLLVMSIPDEDYLSDPRRRTLLVLLLGAVLTTLLAWQSLRLGRRITNPLVALEKATVELQTAGRVDLPESEIREIRSLSLALRSAHAALRERDQMQKHLLQHQKLQTVGTLAGGIAHDVNNQLTAILGQITLGRERLANGLDPDRNLQRAEEATRRCAETTRALLTFSRPATSEHLALDLNAVVSEAAILLKRGLGPAIQLEVDLSPNLPPVMGDPVQLEQVLMNLGMNARDALSKGGCLRLGTAPLGPGEVLMWVEDNGEGMLPDVQSRIFEPFFTTKPEGKGSGLGLSMVHGIAKAHGASLEVDSEWGRGTIIRLRLPVAATPGPQPSQTPVPLKGLWLTGRRILVVEDEPTIRQTVTTILEEAGATCLGAADGESGWAAWGKGAWDLVFSDHLMPRLTGLELLGRIRQGGAKTPVILASGQGLEELGEQLTQDGNLRLLPKPFHLHALLLTIQELLGQEGLGPFPVEHS